jgi:plastocyanin
VRGAASVLVRWIACGLLTGLSARAALAYTGSATVAQSMPTADEDATDANSGGFCGPTMAAETSTMALGELRVVPDCIIVSAGDVVRWVNPTDTDISIRTADDLLTSEDLSQILNTVEVPAQGEATARAIRAGVIEYSAPDAPQIKGTILVLGRGLG